MKKTLVVTIIAFSLVASGSLWAKGQKAATATDKQTKAKLFVASGQIVSADDSKLVISHKVNGKAEEDSFALNSDTSKQGDLTPGAKATVHYTSTAGGDKTATAVKVAHAKHVAKNSAMPQK